MIISAEEFKRLRESEIPEEYHRAANEEASTSVWLDVIEKFPDLKVWVVHNKRIPLEILTILANDPDIAVRERVARTRKIIDTELFNVMANDPEEKVRYALACNTNMSIGHLGKISQHGSQWFQSALKERWEYLNKHGK